MKIAYILPSLSDNSVTTLTRMFVEHFTSRGDYVKVFYFDDIVETSFQCEIERIDIKVPIDFDSFDIVHPQLFRPDKYVYNFRKSIKKAKTLSTIHGDHFQELRYSYGSFISAFFTPAWNRYDGAFDAIVQISPYLLHLYSKSMPKSYLVYNAVNVCFDEVSSHRLIEEKIKEYKESGLKVICSYSSLIRRKGLSQIIRAIAQDSSFAYVCIGDGDEKVNLEKLSISLGVKDRCAFFGFQKSPYLLMRYADIFCISSYSEGFSLAMLEAGSVGSSTVCSDIGAFSAVFSKDEVTFFELGSTASLVSALNVAFEQKMQKALLLKDRIERDFSSAKMLSGYDAVYESLQSR